MQWDGDGAQKQLGQMKDDFWSNPSWHAFITEISINTDTGATSRQRVSDTVCEFPTVPSSLVGKNLFRDALASPMPAFSPPSFVYLRLEFVLLFPSGVLSSPYVPPYSIVVLVRSHAVQAEVAVW